MSSDMLTSKDIRAAVRRMEKHAIKPDERGMLSVPVERHSMLGELLLSDPVAGQSMLSWLNEGCRKDDPFNDEAKRLIQEWIDGRDA